MLEDVKKRNSTIVWLIASERRHARRAINTIQADRRSVVMTVRMHYGHLGEMQQAYVAKKPHVYPCADKAGNQSDEHPQSE